MYFQKRTYCLQFNCICIPIPLRRQQILLLNLQLLPSVSYTTHIPISIPITGVTLNDTVLLEGSGQTTNPLGSEARTPRPRPYTLKSYKLRARQLPRNLAGGKERHGAQVKPGDCRPAPCRGPPTEVFHVAFSGLVVFYRHTSLEHPPGVKSQELAGLKIIKIRQFRLVSLQAPLSGSGVCWTKCPD